MDKDELDEIMELLLDKCTDEQKLLVATNLFDEGSKEDDGQQYIIYTGISVGFEEEEEEEESEDEEFAELRFG